jgi:Tfp pilus assembly protein PilO
MRSQSFPDLASKWQGLKRRERFLVIVFLLLLAGYLSFSFYFRPQIQRLNALQQELRQVQLMQQTALAEGWDNIPGLQQQILETQQHMEILQSEVPSFRNTPGLLVDIYRLASEYDITLNSDGALKKKISFGNLENNGDYSSYDISMELVGSSSNIYGFLYEVQRLGRLLAIDKSTIWSDVPGKLNCDLTIKVFLLGEVEEDPKTYPFMTFERFMEKPYVMFQPGVLKQVPSNSPPLVNPNSVPEQPAPETVSEPIPHQKDLAYLEDETVDPSWEFDIVH